MSPNRQETERLVTYNEEIFIGKLHFFVQLFIVPHKALALC